MSRKRHIDGDDLAARLEDGWKLIDEATDAGDEVTARRLFNHWTKLLSEYERIYRVERSTS